MLEENGWRILSKVKIFCLLGGIYATIMVLFHLLSFLLSTYLIVADEYDYTIIVPAGKTECYGFTIANEKYQSFEVDFQVISSCVFWMEISTS